MKSKRSQEILDYLQDKDFCSMNELMDKFAVSAATMHRDIVELTKKNLVSKIHGGVAVVKPEEDKANAPSSHFTARVMKDTEKKEKIALEAVKYIEDGDIIFLDSSTTALHLGRKIQELSLSNLTLITNSVLLIQEFHLFPRNFFLISLGGNYNYQLHSFLGKAAVENLQNLKLKKLFFSAVGMSKESVTTYHENHAEFLAKALEMATTNYLLLDSTKYGQEGVFNICDSSRIQNLITDKKPPKGLITGGMQVHVA